MNLDRAYLRKGLIALSLVMIVATQTAAQASTRIYPTMRVQSSFSSRLSSTPAFMTPAANNVHVPVLFVSDDKTNAVYLFNSSTFDPRPIGKITDGIDLPTGLAVDVNGNLYVANSNLAAHDFDVAVYHPGALRPFRTIRSTHGVPVAIAVSADGTLAVAYAPHMFLFSPATLVIYDRGSLTPTRTITIGLAGDDLVRLESVAIDVSDNVFLSVGRYPDEIQLLKFAPGSTQGVNVGISPGTGEAFDGRGDFYISYGAIIDVFAPGATQPFRRITNGLNFATFITVAPDGRLFAPNPERFNSGTNRFDPGFVVEYSSQGARITTLRTVVDPIGAALRRALP